MARLPALVNDLAQHDTRGRATVELIARMVREAGYVQTTGRGRSAAEMTPHDAAALLIGLCASEAPKDAPKAVALFSSLSAFGSGQADSTLLEKFPSELGAVASSPTFLEALANIISSSEVILGIRNSSTKGPGRHDFPSAQRGVPGNSFYFSISFYQPMPRAKILIEWDDEEAGLIRRFQRQFLQQITESGDLVSPHLNSDRSIEISVGLGTFIRLKRILAGG